MSAPGTNAEDRLCLLLACGSLSQARRTEAFSLLAQPLDWDQIMERAQQHEIYPLVFRNLKGLQFAGAPDAILEQMEALCRVNALRSTLLSEELARLLASLDRAGVKAIPFKGPALSERLYGDRALRVCADLDILVPRERIARAVAVLQADGYEAEFPPWFLTARMLRNNFEYPLTRSQRGLDCYVELHWTVLWQRPADADSAAQLWGEAVPTRFDNVPTHRLSPEWEFLFLAAHAARHNWQGLKWLVDLDEFCVQQKVDWSKAHAHAVRLGWEGLARKTFGVCRALLGTPVPSPFAAEMPQRIRWYPAEPMAATPWENTQLCRSLARGPVEKVRILLRRIFVPNLMDGAQWRLPDSLGWLYYALRPLRLALDVIRKPGRKPGRTPGGPHASEETKAAAAPAIHEKR